MRNEWSVGGRLGVCWAASWVVLLLVANMSCSREGHGEEGHGEEGHGEEGVAELSESVAERLGIRVVPVRLRKVAGLLETTGRVDFDQERIAHVAARVPGRVVKIEAVLGSTVRKGTVLAVLDSLELAEAKSTFLQARTELRLADSTLQRQRKLASDHIVSEQAVQEAEAAAARARAAFESARRRLLLMGLGAREIDRIDANNAVMARFPIRSPLDGEVVEKHLVVGEVVEPDETLFTVADLSRLWVWVDVYERDLRHVHLGDQVVVTAEAFPEERFSGTVSYLSARVDPDTRTVRARVEVPNASRKLRPGMFVRVVLEDPHGEDGAEVPERIVVPASAVQRDGREKVVFVRTAPRRFERREVVVGRRAGDVVEILDGLQPGEEVAVSHAFLLKSEARKGAISSEHSH